MYHLDVSGIVCILVILLLDASGYVLLIRFSHVSLRLGYCVACSLFLKLVASQRGIIFCRESEV